MGVGHILASPRGVRVQRASDLVYSPFSVGAVVGWAGWPPFGSHSLCSGRSGPRPRRQRPQRVAARAVVVGVVNQLGGRQRVSFKIWATAWAHVVRGSGLLYMELYANDGPSVTTPLTPTVLRDGDEGSGSENQ